MIDWHLDRLTRIVKFGICKLYYTCLDSLFDMMRYINQFKKMFVSDFIMCRFR